MGPDRLPLAMLTLDENIPFLPKWLTKSLLNIREHEHIGQMKIKNQCYLLTHQR